jgi:hypothetical protein
LVWLSPISFSLPSLGGFASKVYPTTRCGGGSPNPCLNGMVGPDSGPVHPVGADRQDFESVQ